MSKKIISEGDIWSVDTIEVLDFYSSFVIYEKILLNKLFKLYCVIRI